MFEFHTDRSAYHNLLRQNVQEQILPFIRKHKSLPAGSRVLEIGSGDGGNLSAFLEAGCTCVGVELDAGLVEFTKQKLSDFIASGQLQMVARDIYEVDVERDFGGRFDLVVLKDVIEHIHDQPKLMRRMQDMLKPGGMVFFGFPPWQMPFGGHQQICKGRLTSKMPWYHLLPESWYRSILQRNGEPVDVLMEIRETGISIERFERIVKETGFQVAGKILWLVNPVYQYKFGWKPRKQLPVLRSLPWVRNFFTTCAYYLIQKKKED
jgi:SAM-dependent methyltransferase